MISKGGFQTRPYETFVLFVSFVVKNSFTFGCGYTALGAWW